MIVYIAGKMTGLPGKGRAEFYQVEQELRELGHVVLNPARLPDGLPPHSYMPICLAMLQQAEAIYMLDNWRDSPGAKLELDFARYQGKRILMDGQGPLHRKRSPSP